MDEFLLIGVLAAITPDPQQGWTIALAVIVLMVQLIQSVIMANFNSKISRIQTLEGDLKAAMASAINSRFATYEQDLTRIYARLERGESHFQNLDEARHKLEVNLLKELGALKDRVATKEDLNRIRGGGD